MEIVRRDGSSIEVGEFLIGHQKLILVYTGFNYTIREPLFHYLRVLARQRHFDLLSFDFEYYRNQRFQGLSETDQDEWFQSDIDLVEARTREIRNAYEKVIHVGKSLGTSVIYFLLERNKIPEGDKLVLLTPGVMWPKTIELLLQKENEVLVLGAMDDVRFAVPDLPNARARKKSEIQEFEVGGHLLETDDLYETFDIHKVALARIEKFIGR